MKKIISCALLIAALPMMASVSAVESVVAEWRKIGFRKEILSSTDGRLLDFPRCRLAEYDSCDLIKNERKVVLIGPCNPCIAIGIEHGNGMCVCHLVTEEMLDIRDDNLSDEFKTMMEQIKGNFGDVKSFFIFTRPYWDQQRDDLYKCQLNSAKILAKESERLFGDNKGKYLISTDQCNPYIAVVCDGEKFSLAAPQDLSFIVLSLKQGEGISFKKLDEEYAKHREKFDKSKKRENYFLDMGIFKACFESLMPAGMLSDGTDVMDWLYNRMLCHFRNRFKENGKVEELTFCLWEDKTYGNKIEKAFLAIDKDADEKTFGDNSFAIFLRYIFTKYYACALYADYLEKC